MQFLNALVPNTSLSSPLLRQEWTQWGIWTILLRSGPDLGAPRADEGDIIEYGNAGDLGQGSHDILHIHVAQQDAGLERLLQLLHPPMDVFWLQQMEPAANKISAPWTSCAWHTIQQSKCSRWGHLAVQRPMANSCSHKGNEA